MAARLSRTKEEGQIGISGSFDGRVPIRSSRALYSFVPNTPCLIVGAAVPFFDDGDHNLRTPPINRPSTTVGTWVSQQ